MIENARASTPEHLGIDYRVIDATDGEALLALGERRFDAAVCTMAMMDMAAIEPLLASLSKLLNTDGRFVFSILHPCFNSSSVKLVAEESVTGTGRMVTRYYITVCEYIRSRPTKGVAMKDQPLAQYYFNRPLSALFNACFKFGFVLDGLEEPTFPESPDDGRANWSNFTEIPPMLVARMRLSNQESAPRARQDA